MLLVCQSCVLVFENSAAAARSSNNNRAVGVSPELPEVLRNATTDDFFYTLGPPRNALKLRQGLRVPESAVNCLAQDR